MSIAFPTGWLFHGTSRRLVRPWALCAPILALLICLPLLRPLRVPDPGMVSDDEQSRLATIQAIVESPHPLSYPDSLAIEGTQFRDTTHKIFAASELKNAIPPHLYSDQPPMLAVLLSGPYWVMHRLGLTFDNDPNWAIFWLTLLGVTLPVALSAGLVYKMGRLFELKRPWRVALALVVLLGSGLISYATVLNAHAPAAALVLLSAACLFHVIVHNQPRCAGGWITCAGLCAALSATIDPPAVVFLILFLAVVGAFHWPIRWRLASAGLYLAGALLPLLVHAALVVPITGNLLPGFLHPELQVGSNPAANASAEPRSFVATVHRATPTPRATPAPIEAYDEEAHAAWHSILRGTQRVLASFAGDHGIFSHFPIVLLGILGVTLVMHRHWPAATKMLAGGTLAGALCVILVYSLRRHAARDAMFATGSFVVFLPLTLFWAGAWLRRPHRRTSWAIVSALLAFSVAVSLIGATGPLPRGGFDRYSVAGAWRNLIHPPPSAPADLPVAQSSNAEP